MGHYARPVRLLCISDIHGHADALAAVLATAERRGYGKILVAGDLCFPGPEPLEVWRRLTQAGAVCVQGIGDRALATVAIDGLVARSEHERVRLDRLAAVRAELGELILARLARLPVTFRMPLAIGGELVLVHGSPSDPTECLTHDMSDEEMLSLLGDDPADVVVCGGSHVPFDRMVRGVRVINVGSVGEAGSGDGKTRHADATFIEIAGGPGASVAELVVEAFSVPLLAAGSSEIPPDPPEKAA